MRTYKTKTLFYSTCYILSFVFLHLLLVLREHTQLMIWGGGQSAVFCAQSKSCDSPVARGRNNLTPTCSRDKICMTPPSY